MHFQAGASATVIVFDSNQSINVTDSAEEVEGKLTGKSKI
jgi:hypothetical protein